MNIQPFKFITKTLSILLVVVVITNVNAEESQKRSLQEVIQLVLTNYPSIKIAKLEIERATQEFAKIESQLGWVVNTQAGISRDLGVFNIPSERFDARASIGSVQESGNRVEVIGQYSYEDSESVAIPSIANPLERTSVDLNYRVPFGQGQDNPVFEQGRILAESGLESTQATRIKQVDALVKQTLSIYYDTANTYMRIHDANKAIDRASRLLEFVKKNKSLGLAENKDLLIVKALLNAKIADRDNLLTIWSRQRTELNRLIGVKPDSEFVPVIAITKQIPEQKAVLGQVYGLDPDLMLQTAQLKSVQSSIELASDAKKDKFDLVLSVGARNTSGDTATGSVSQSEWAGGARVEYQFAMDQRGFDAELYQAMLDKQVIEEEITRIKRDLGYDVTGLLEQVKQNLVSEKSSRIRLLSERAKVDEAFKRYKVGRADTSELIDNENSLFASSLLYETRKIELARRCSELELLRGLLWDRKLLLGNIKNENNQP